MKSAQTRERWVSTTRRSLRRIPRRNRIARMTMMKIRAFFIGSRKESSDYESAIQHLINNIKNA